MAERAADERGYFIVRPIGDKYNESKKRGRGGKYDHDEYEEEKEEVRQRRLDEQIRGVTSSIKKKPVRDIENFYYVIEVSKEASNGALYSALRGLRATVHAYLDKDHLLLLVSSPAATLSKFQRKDLPYSIASPILRIRELRRSEQVSSYLDQAWKETKVEVLVNLMPNEKSVVLARYVAEIREFLRQRNSPVVWAPAPEQGMLETKIDKRVGEDLMQQTNYIFNIHTVPKGIPSAVVSRGQMRRVLAPRGKRSSLQRLTTAETAELPKVCVADSGVNDIAPLSSLVTERKGVAEFAENCTDGCNKEGHGTPIAYLVAKGDDEGHPRARIISYKIYSESNEDVAYQGMIEAIQKYRGEAKIFVSSINFEDETALTSYAKLDSLIQESNICFVNSAGNLSMDVVRSNAQDYPSYISNFHLLHPAQNASVIGVGSISRAGNDSTIAPKGGLSPFTRCGKSLQRLFEVTKPDVVDDGGNVTKSFDPVPVNIPVFAKDGSPAKETTGTSFSAPLVAGRLAEIVERFGSDHNAELYNAVMQLSCDGGESPCFGSGTPQKLRDTEHREAVFLAEGTVSLSDRLDVGIEHIFYSRVTIPVPDGVRRIEMYLVHSDDFYDDHEPSLDTYLRVNAWKAGRPSGRVPAENDKVLQSLKSCVKHFVWKYKRSMGGTWNFDIIPGTTMEIDPLKRSNTKVRYGCAIRITSTKPSIYSLANQVVQMMKQWEGTSVAQF